MTTTNTNTHDVCWQNKQQQETVTVVTASTMQYLTQHPSKGTQQKRVCTNASHVCRWSIAAGKRPVPFRTRKLSLHTLMVLQPGGCGRVSHRRHQTTKTKYYRSRRFTRSCSPTASSAFYAHFQRAYAMHNTAQLRASYCSRLFYLGSSV